MRCCSGSRKGEPSRRSVLRYGVIGGLALPLAQLGHLLAYWVRYGEGALRLQASGVHGYFPATIQTSLALLGTLLLSFLLLIGLGRSLGGRCYGQSLEPGWPVASSALTLLIVQLLAFVAQEYAEALLQQSRAPALLPLAAYGVMGQLPVAMVAAVTLAWTTRRARHAIASLCRSGAVAIRPTPTTALPCLRPQPLAEVAPIGSVLAVAAKRGPPSPPSCAPST
jgi:hypothetical protein